jgi:hypothetical protein
MLRVRESELLIELIELQRCRTVGPVRASFGLFWAGLKRPDAKWAKKSMARTRS